MPRKNKKSERPEVMTRSKRMPIIVAAALFDAARAFFYFFAITGPAVAGLYCTIKGADIASSFSFGLLGGKTAALVCGALAIGVGSAGSFLTIPLGAVMADAIGLLGFLSLGLWIVLTNSRILKSVANAPLQFGGAFLVGEIPFLGAFPVFTGILWRLYGAQIRADEEALRRWEAEQKEEEKQERLALAAERQEIENREAANEAAYAEAANDASYAQDSSSEAEQTAAPSNVVRFPTERTRSSGAAATNIPQTFKKAA